MNRKATFASLLVLLVMLPGLGCQADRQVAPTSPGEPAATAPDAEALAVELVRLAEWEPGEDQVLPPVDAAKSGCPVVLAERVEVAPGIAHYYWEVQVGFAPEDRIGLHRVVKESRPRVPIRSRLNLFLQHGDAKDFAGMWLPGTLSASTPDDFGAAVYWAREGVDVWGIDQAWNLVPAETTDFGFMADWGVDKQYRDLGLAVAIARTARLLTGNGFDRLNLLGYSSGSVTGYALVNAEAALPPGLRQVGGWIPVDYSPLTDDADWNAIQNCGYVPYYEDQIANGQYGYFVGFDYLGNLARSDPDGDSPVFPGFNNLQAALYLGAGQIFNVGEIHYLAGVWEDGLPVDLVNLSIDQWLDFMIAGAPWEPMKFLLDYSVWGCNEVDVPWDDHFAEITLPVLNVAPAGGIGPTTHWCLGLLGSGDITDLVIRTLPEDQALYDIGHIDLWVARQAPELVWRPILDWVVAHAPRGHDPRHPHH